LSNKISIGKLGTAKILPIQDNINPDKTNNEDRTLLL